MKSILVFARRHTTFVFGIAIVAALSGIFLVSRVKFDANILRFLPQRSPTVRDVQLLLRDFGSLDHRYVVFNSTGAIGDHGELVNRYVEALRHAPEIQSVDAQLFEPGKDWSYLSDRNSYLIGAAAVEDPLDPDLSERVPTTRPSSARDTMARRLTEPMRATIARAPRRLNRAGSSSSGSARKSFDLAGARYRKSTSAFSGVASRPPEAPASSNPKKNPGSTWWIDTVPRGVVNRRVRANDTA